MPTTRRRRRSMIIHTLQYQCGHFNTTIAEKLQDPLFVAKAANLAALCVCVERETHKVFPDPSTSVAQIKAHFDEWAPLMLYHYHNALCNLKAVCWRCSFTVDKTAEESVDCCNQAEIICRQIFINENSA